MSFWDAVGAYIQYKGMKDANKPGEVNYTISPQMEELFKRLMGLVDYSPTREYISDYAHNFLKSANAPGGMFDYKPEFKSDYMKGNELPNMPRLDFGSIASLNGDKNGKMPWNFGYTGPGIGGQPTKPGGPGGAPTGPNGNPIGGGGRMGQKPGGFSKDMGEWDAFNWMTGGTSDYGRAGVVGPGGYQRNGFGMLIGAMNSNNPDAGAAMQRYSDWYNGLDDGTRKQEDARTNALNQYLRSLPGDIGRSAWASIKAHPLDFAGALLLAGPTGGMSLVGFFVDNGMGKDAIGGITSIFKPSAPAAPPPGGNGNPSMPGGM